MFLVLSCRYTDGPVAIGKGMISAKMFRMGFPFASFPSEKVKSVMPFPVTAQSLGSTSLPQGCSV